MVSSSKRFIVNVFKLWCFLKIGVPGVPPKSSNIRHLVIHLVIHQCSFLGASLCTAHIMVSSAFRLTILRDLGDESRDGGFASLGPALCSLGLPGTATVLHSFAY